MERLSRVNSLPSVLGKVFFIVKGLRDYMENSSRDFLLNRDIVNIVERYIFIVFENHL